MTHVFEMNFEDESRRTSLIINVSKHKNVPGNCSKVVGA